MKIVTPPTVWLEYYQHSEPPYWSKEEAPYVAYVHSSLDKAIASLSKRLQLTYTHRQHEVDLVPPPTLPASFDTDEERHRWLRIAGEYFEYIDGITPLFEELQVDR